MERTVLDAMLANGIQATDWLVITFFTESKNRLVKNLNAESFSENIIPAEKITSGASIQQIKTFLSQQGKLIVLGERHPLSSHEVAVAEKLSENRINLPLIAFAALDDALLQHFGGERVKLMMQRMGMKEDELIEHSMIEKSIENAQKKIAEKIMTESRTKSAEEWFQMNFHPDSSQDGN